MTNFLQRIVYKDCWNGQSHHSIAACFAEIYLSLQNSVNCLQWQIRIWVEQHNENYASVFPLFYGYKDVDFCVFGVLCFFAIHFKVGRISSV